MRHLAKMGREIRKFLIVAGQKLRDKERDFEDEGFLYKTPVSVLNLINYKFRPFHFEIKITLYGKTHSFVFRSLLVLVRNCQQDNKERVMKDTYFRNLKIHF